MTHLRWANRWLETGQGFPCLFHFFTGFYCPGCGGTRAVRLLLKGDLAGSFQYHPFVLYVCGALAVELEYCFAYSLISMKDQDKEIVLRMNCMVLDGRQSSGKKGGK